MRAVLIAADLRDGREWLASQPWLPPEMVTVVTPRSPDSCRGRTVDAVLATPRALDLPAGTFDALLMVCLPCVMAKQW